MFKKKQAKKLIFAPKIALRVELSDLALNSFFPADFLSARLQCSQFLWNCAKIKAVPPPIDQCLKFKNHCSLMSIHYAEVSAVLVINVRIRICQNVVNSIRKACGHQRRQIRLIESNAKCRYLKT